MSKNSWNETDKYPYISDETTITGHAKEFAPFYPIRIRIGEETKIIDNERELPHNDLFVIEETNVWNGYIETKKPGTVKLINKIIRVLEAYRDGQKLYSRYSYRNQPSRLPLDAKFPFINEFPSFTPNLEDLMDES